MGTGRVAFIFRCSYLGCTNVYKGYMLLLDFSLYHYLVIFFVPYYILCFKVYFVRHTCCYLSFLKNFYLHEISFFIPSLLVCVNISF